MLVPLDPAFHLVPKSTTTQKPKEPKTMSTTKKSETSHGKSLHAPAKAPEAKAAAVPYRPTVGDVVRITKDTCCHCFPINSVHTIKKDDKGDLPYYPGAKKNPYDNWFTPGDCELITKSADVVKASKEAKATAKPKYPAARVQRELIAEAKPLEKRTKAELIETAQDLAVQFHNLAADHCIAGTKLDRALVDLKEAKAKIKELTKGTEAVK